MGERLREIGPLIRDCRPQSAWRAGVSAPVATAAGLHTALTQARYALAAARSPAPDGQPVVVQGELGGLAMLLAGVPADVRKVYRETVLGPLLAAGPKSGPMLLETLRAFLDHDCSWARTAEALHIHVNTVHYRVQRIELLTGRDLSRLDNRLDLRTALLC
ncbi:PucR family transcriptional regulator [Streptomyces sp. SID2563]|nr:PucR family transcriptional regulator [Streptomyces sp. SID2563]